MSYQALLFCPDEKTARTVTQVLSDLEFSVEPCSEPFAAVKKLMAQHFDAIVVDCDNEQNAALLFKSARNSSSNQTSLSVAVVEGQAGVAKAFRLGANLVLTKPIHIEQSKATLRVARGLLRKGQAAKPPATVAVFPEPVGPPPLPAPVPFPAPRATAPPVASASAFEIEAEPTPQPDTVDAALLEYMPDSAPSSSKNVHASATDSPESKQYPWQPRKEMAEPMASALRRAAEAAGKAEFENPPTGQASATPTSAGSGAAAAPARARESKITPIESKIGTAKTASGKTDESEQSAAEVWQAHSAAVKAEASEFATLDDTRDALAAQQSSGKGGSKKGLVVAVVLLGVAAAGYFGWTRMQSRQAQPVQQSVAPAQTSLASQPPAPETAAPEAQPSSPEASAQTEQTLTASGPVSSSKPSAAVLSETAGSRTASPAAKPTGIDSPVTALKAPAAATPASSEPLLVKNGESSRHNTEAVSQEPEQPPTATSISTGADTSAVAGLVNTNAINAQRAAQQTVRISQGVSQGLIVKRVQPVYPAQAMQMRLEGVVELQANISKTGNITGIKQLSGQSLLGRAAMDAVQQWKYKPYFLNGEPVEVQTQITVNFKLP
jgi:TonB family protein